MSYQNAYNTYQKTNISTASQGRLVVLLYEGALKNMKAAENLFENDTIKAKNIEQFGNYIQKTQAIITELQVSLNMEKGADIARNLMALYVYFNEELVSVNINHDRQKLTSVIKMMNDLLISWRQIVGTSASVQPQMQNSLNITS